MNTPPWQRLAEECWRDASFLRSDEPPRVRACLNRAYYSAYAALTHAIIRHGRPRYDQARGNPSHEQLIKLVRSNLDERKFSDDARRRLSSHLRRLRGFRLMADYNPESAVGVTEAVYAMRTLGEIRRVLAEEPST